MEYKDETSEKLYIIYIIICFRDLPLNAETEGKIRSLEMWIYRRMFKISYKQHISKAILVGLNVDHSSLK